jgi:hypothetical protein
VQASKCTKKSYIVFPAWNACAAGYINVAGVCWQRCDSVHFGFHALFDCGRLSAVECSVDTNVCSGSAFSVVSPTLQALVGVSSPGASFRADAAIITAVTAVGHLVFNLVRVGTKMCPGHDQSSMIAAACGGCRCATSTTRVSGSHSDTCPVPVPAYSQRTCHSTLLGVFWPCCCRLWCRAVASYMLPALCCMCIMGVPGWLRCRALTQPAAGW